MFENFLAIITRPANVAISTAIGVTCAAYLQDAVIQSLQWYIPCLCVIACDLASGVRAAKYRKDNISFSSALRRTGNKMLVYLCWVLMAVTLGIMYEMPKACATIMSVVIVIEMGSCISNILEPHGIMLNWKTLLNVVGKKKGYEGLGDVIEKKESNGKRKNNKRALPVF